MEQLLIWYVLLPISSLPTDLGGTVPGSCLHSKGKSPASLQHLRVLGSGVLAAI